MKNELTPAYIPIGPSCGPEHGRGRGVGVKEVGQIIPKKMGLYFFLRMSSKNAICKSYHGVRYQVGVCSFFTVKYSNDLFDISRSLS